MEKKGPREPMGLRKETREWLATHAVRDVREIVADLEDAGEDVSELVDALDELERYVAEGSASRRVEAKA